MSLMLPLLHEIIRRCRAGERLALCTLVRARGSTPQATGAKMLVLANGQLLGTLGGGCVEAEVRRRATELLLANQSKLLTFKLDHDYGWDDGLICGGIMDVYIDILEGPAPADRFEKLARAIEAREDVPFEISYETDEGPQLYREQIAPTPTLIIAGAGHVGQALATLAANLDFHVVILDDRPEFASETRFPNAGKRIVGDIESELASFPTDDNTYIVIVTRGHRHDGRALAQVIRSNAKYIGLIGSKRKIRTILEDLAAQGIPRELLYKVHAPIGLDINAVSVHEIAISIAAELIAVRRGKPDTPAPPMKLDPASINQWLDRPKL